MPLVWVDLETTGLDARTCQILELALVITDDQLNIIEEHVWVINPGEVRLGNKWVIETHVANGLLLEVARSTNGLSQVEAEASDIVRRLCPGHKPRLGGSSPQFDRSFIAEHMPALSALLSHQHFDTTTLEQAFRLWCPGKRRPRDARPEAAHRAMDDIKWSIETARYYQGIISVCE